MSYPSSFRSSHADWSSRSWWTLWKKTLLKTHTCLSFLFLLTRYGLSIRQTGSCLHHCLYSCIFVLSEQTKSTEHYTEVSDSWRTAHWSNHSRSWWPTTIRYLLTSKPSVVSDVDLLDCLVVLLGRSLQGFLGAPVSDGKFITKYYITLHYCGIF